MSEIQAIIQSPSGQRQLHLIDLLSGLEPVDDHHQVEIGALEKDPAQYGFTAASLESDLDVMKGRGWVDFWHSLDGIGSVIIKQTGLDAAKQYRAFLKNRVERRKACRDAVLQWLDEDEDNRKPFRLDRTFFGHPYMEQEEIDAKIWLKEEGFIHGPARADGDIYYPQITSKGRRVVEDGRSVNESYSEGIITVADNSINIHGSQNVNVAHNSSNVTQSNALTQEQLGAINEVLESYRTMIDHLCLSEDQLLKAETIVGELEEEVRDANAEPGKIRQGLERLGGIVSEHGARGFATALFSLIEQALQNLG